LLGLLAGLDAQRWQVVIDGADLAASTKMDAHAAPAWSASCSNRSSPAR
jgi:hypothetical protein